MKLGKPTVSVPFIHAENGAKILIHVLNKYEEQGRMSEHETLLKEMAEIMQAFMYVRLDKALKLAQKYAVLKFEEFEYKTARDIEMRGNLIRATEELRGENKWR